MKNSHTLPIDTLVVVTTGEQAKLFKVSDVHADHGVSLQYEREVGPSNLDDDGPAGKRPPESSKQETDEATFSKQLGQFLYRRAHSGKFDSLLLIADPDTLGELRPLLHEEVTVRIVMELAKTLINSPTEDIEAAVTRALGDA